ncbi:hypothetical protein FHS20_001238 [Phyllobacterium endophyticum]|nr:hypothetical protein [Phyllobacterium endophyticum]
MSILVAIVALLGLVAVFFGSIEEGAEKVRPEVDQ